MAWIMDAYGQLNGYTPGIVTGKPVELGGSFGREAATGRGLVYCLSEWARLVGYPLEQATVLVQGFGQVGSWVARLITELGAKVVGVSDIQGGIYDSGGIDIPGLLEHRQHHPSVVGFRGAGPVGIEEFLGLPCDILVPAAIQRVVHRQNADSIKAMVIAKGANHPLTPEADMVLYERGVTILPDILVNAGGVAVSYFEWAQNIQQFRWTEERVNEELKSLMSGATRRVVDKAAEDGTSLREAAFVIAVGRVGHAIELRGFV